MHELKCRTIRLWLQAPDELAPLDARHLDRHLAECPACADYRRRQVELDRHIHYALNSAIGTTSLRAGVRAQLQAATAHTPRQRRLAIRLRSSLIRRLLLPAAVAVPVSVVAVLALLFLPPALHHHAGTPTNAAHWHVIRKDIGYPLTVDPTRSDHLLAGAWGQVYESWNAGQSWHQLGTLHHVIIRDVAIDASEPHRYLVATLHSIFVSNDAGRHWQLAANSLLGAMNMFLMQNPRAPSTFYVGPSILWRSIDHGRTWSPAGRGAVFAPSGIQSLTVAPNGDLLTGIWNGGVAVSHDGGVTWQRRAHGLAPKTMDVVVGPHQQLWAATNRGVYTSTDYGLHWRRSGPHAHFFTTGVLAGSGYVLAGGNGGVFRSIDGGKHWAIANSGLPMEAYVYGFVADPHHPLRVYASLDNDGIFCSDDGGIHWHAAESGLPLTGDVSAPSLVLFRRGGQLFKTNGNGSDPGNLALDEDVKLAAVSPDDAAVAYVNGEDNNWAVRVISSGGSAQHTLLTGTGPLPRSIAWSPNSLLVAVDSGAGMTVVDLAAHQHHWAHGAGDQFLGWTRDAHNLFFWNSRTGRITTRTWVSGAPTATSAARFSHRPLIAPDGQAVGMVSAGRLQIGWWRQGIRSIVPVRSTCRTTHWADDSSRLLLTCGSTVQVRTRAGRLLGHAHLPSDAVWVPGSHQAILFFRNGSLFRWTLHGHLQRLVTPAEPIGATRS
jgi:photosystem II stability/assembly factor-like uncharacterized protein